MYFGDFRVVPKHIVEIFFSLVIFVFLVLYNDRGISFYAFGFS